MKKLPTPPLSRLVETNQARLDLVRTVAIYTPQKRKQPLHFPHPFVKIIDLLLCEGLEDTSVHVDSFNIFFLVKNVFIS